METKPFRRDSSSFRERRRGGNRRNEKNGDISRRANFLARLPADNNSSGSGVAGWGWNFISIPPVASARGGTRFRPPLFAGVV